MREWGSEAWSIMTFYYDSTCSTWHYVKHVNLRSRHFNNPCQTQLIRSEQMSSDIFLNVVYFAGQPWSDTRSVKHSLLGAEHTPDTDGVGYSAHPYSLSSCTTLAGYLWAATRIIWWPALSLHVLSVCMRVQMCECAFLCVCVFCVCVCECFVCVYVCVCVCVCVCVFVCVWER